MWLGLIFRKSVPVLLAGILMIQAGFSQDLATFRADIAEVRVDVQVTNGGKPVPGLTVSDFEVYDQESLQPVSRFGREADPLALVLLLDVSGSMKRYVQQMASTARNALTYLKEEDRISVMAFAKETEVLSEFTNRFEVVQREIEVGVEQHNLSAGTAIYNAVVTAARELQEEARRTPHIRRGVIILTDNESLNYQINEKQVLESLFSADAVLNAIVTGNSSRPKPRKQGEYRNPDFTPTDIFRIAEETGGEAFKVDRADKIFPVLMERMRNRYSLVYKAPSGSPGEYRKIRVELSPDAKRKYPKAQVKARSGYYMAF